MTRRPGASVLALGVQERSLERALEHYERIRKALARDTTEGIAPEATAPSPLARDIAGEGARRAATSLAQDRDIDAAREQFGVLSEAPVPEFCRLAFRVWRDSSARWKQKRWVQRCAKGRQSLARKVNGGLRHTNQMEREVVNHHPMAQKEHAMKRHAILAIGAALLLGGSAVAQQDQQQKPSTAQEKPQMSMDEMMKGCREHCQQTSTSIDRLMQRMDGARQSNDPARMRAALDEAQKPLADMKQHMNMCMNMMGMMQKMPGKAQK